MITLWLHDREWFVHLYRPSAAPRSVGAMVSSSPRHLALSAGIRGWWGIVAGWNRPDPARMRAAGCHRENGFRKVEF